MVFKKWALNTSLVTKLFERSILILILLIPVYITFNNKYDYHIKNMDIVYLPCSKKELHHTYMQQNLAKSFEFSAKLLQDMQDYHS